MTRTLRRPIFVTALPVIAAMCFASAAQAGAPTFSPVPVPRPQAQIAQQAQIGCAVRSSVISKLKEKYGESRRGGGLGAPMAIFEIWVSEATGTWTILRTTVNGWTCVMAVGYNWRDDNAEPTSAGDPV